MEDRIKTMKRIKSDISTHDCPSCRGLAYCAMEAGKSASTCWCMLVDKEYAVPDGIEKCLCKKCLTASPD